jgi:NADP-dependent 3-hydroxy acid dehydrogenase YdfG
MILDSFKLDCKLAVISGAGKGIGAYTHREPCGEGAGMIDAARTKSDIDETVRQIQARGRQGLAVVCDGNCRDQREALVVAARERFGRIDVLVNNAGG